uniref:Methyltransferase domain-containing protein n=1 Tax=Leersia perrieri TaxID=77586 RepID=A0A0D9X649_9ORYZ
MPLYGSSRRGNASFDHVRKAAAIEGFLVRAGFPRFPAATPLLLLHSPAAYVATSSSFSMVTTPPPGIEFLISNCGSGDLAFLLSQKVGMDGQVMAVDFSSQQLQTAASHSLSVASPRDGLLPFSQAEPTTAGALYGASTPDDEESDPACALSSPAHALCSPARPRPDAAAARRCCWKSSSLLLLLLPFLAAPNHSPPKPRGGGAVVPDRSGTEPTAATAVVGC